ncbi:MAG: NTP transferase domain-containing protein [Candidatus Nitronauta litoralis]|uniref:NTP transferase domain-containing protein n=1 Tax=Candidatus Nitronauta litoralis TaxID=2705533 RepID=A0A7T0BW69_9BACT|nr:MAG: NTP transferase domain-containing protein [Candidatus Nitronauta litoralis]
MSQSAAIIQARTGSTRYPGKALAEISGVPMTEHIINRVKAAGVFDHIILAVPDLNTETPLVEIADRLNITCHKGPEDDVLERFIGAAESVGATNLLRVCGDNPLIDIPLMIELSREHTQSGADYTIVKDPVPLGTGSEMVRLAALKKIAEATREPKYIEHVTSFFADHEADYNVKKISAPFYLRNLPLRLTVDTSEDLELIRHLYEKFYISYLPVDLEQVVFYLVNRPEIYGMNAHVEQKDWRQ